MKHRYVPVTPLPAAQMGAPQIMHLAPLLLAVRASRSEAISSLRLVSLLFFTTPSANSSMEIYRPCQQVERLRRAVRRVLPLCAALCPSCGCVRGAAEKARVAPTCGQVPEQRRESPPQRGKILPQREGQHRIWLVAGIPASCQMPNIGQKPTPTTSSQSPLRV